MTGTQRLVIEGKRFVLVRESEYEQLCREAKRIGDVAEDDLPALPKPDRQGRYPAVEYTRVSIARDLIRERKSLGLSQSQLADRAGVRQETISRIESGKQSVTVRTYDKIFQAIEVARKRNDTRKGK